MSAHVGTIYTEVSIDGVRLRQCLRCGALVGGWSPEIGDGEWRHQEWHNVIDVILHRAIQEEQ